MESSNGDTYVLEGNTPCDESIDQQAHPPETQQSDVGQQTTTMTTEDSGATTIDSGPSKAGPFSFRACFASTLTANVLVLPGILLALTALVGMILSQRWTTRNDKLQDCINLRQIDISSEACNETIESGVPSFWRKRGDEIWGMKQHLDLALNTYPRSSYSFALVLVSGVMLSCVALSVLVHKIYRLRSGPSHATTDQDRAFPGSYQPTSHTSSTPPGTPSLSEDQASASESSHPISTTAQDSGSCFTELLNPESLHIESNRATRLEVSRDLEAALSSRTTPSASSVHPCYAQSPGGFGREYAMHYSPPYAQAPVRPAKDFEKPYTSPYAQASGRFGQSYNMQYFPPSAQASGRLGQSYNMQNSPPRAPISGNLRQDLERLYKPSRAQASIQSGQNCDMSHTIGNSQPFGRDLPDQNRALSSEAYPYPTESLEVTSNSSAPRHRMRLEDLFPSGYDSSFADEEAMDWSTGFNNSPSRFQPESRKPQTGQSNEANVTGLDDLNKSMWANLRKRPQRVEEVPMSQKP